MQTALLLEKSEPFFKPLNISVEFSNLACLVTAFWYRHSSAIARQKLLYLAVSYALSLVLTAYVLTVMLPLNKRIASLAKELGNTKGGDHDKQFRDLQERWRRRNYGRVMLKAGIAVVGMRALLAG